ncbi:iron-sulfur cluster biosynthesis family protein [Gracilibacillus alcaliphilus]|uniref:iron-sulfur cluster biosynthesis family protein n=1 Tax=Gracilibacillus alcaliphilus TaxID=1401441 RepID=UPI00195E79AB|nr:iron-sulfur cluster biosynthesis family protein [Gracilibacillus alcaliphilus]MBM7675104.1 uncharacterized protein YqkB [Gracilibacillus alcaliphilus]
MKLTITDQALKKLMEINNEEQLLLALTYDTEGCGCGVNGMPTITLIKEQTANQHQVECEQAQTVVQHQQAVFFNKDMKLDYNGATFRLSSPEEMLNPFISVQAVQQTME